MANIPQKVSSDDLIDALRRNRQGIDNVEAKLDFGHVNAKELEDLAMSAGRTVYLCRELIRWRNLQLFVRAAEKEEYPDLEWVP